MNRLIMRLITIKQRFQKGGAYTDEHEQYVQRIAASCRNRDGTCAFDVFGGSAYAEQQFSKYMRVIENPNANIQDRYDAVENLIQEAKQYANYKLNC